MSKNDDNRKKTTPAQPIRAPCAPHREVSRRLAVYNKTVIDVVKLFSCIIVDSVGIDAYETFKFLILFSCPKNDF